jgi:hypothetical protein
MAVDEITRQRLDNLDGAFQRIEARFQVGGARAAAAKAIDDAQGVMATYAPTIFAAEVNRRMRNDIAGVERNARAFDGAPDDAPLSASWNGLRSAIQTLYVHAWSIQDNLPVRTTAGAVGAALSDPAGLVREAGRFGGDVVGEAAGAAGGAAGLAAWEIIKGIWPIVAIAGALVAGALIYSARKAAA